MKKQFLIFFITMVIALNVNAKGPQGVRYTKHNLANWNTAAEHFRATNVNEICVFCHTPHFAGEQPLWNREVKVRTSSSGASISVQSLSDNNTAFVAYTSANISAVPKKLGYQTLLCMSCHDGVTSMGVLYKSPKTPITWYNNRDQIGAVTPSPADIGNASTFFPNLAGYSNGTNNKNNAYSYYADGWGMMFGVHRDPSTGQILGNTADHPISVNYDYVLSKKPNDFRAKSSTGLKFFDINGGENGSLLECSTCHDPHVNYVNTAANGDVRYTPFLAEVNSSSSLCFRCHIK